MDLTETFDSLKLETIERFVAEQQEEHLLLDFKMVANAELSNGDDRRNLARALSGFANSSGGLIVWGVDARKRGDGPDVAQELKPIARVPVLLSRLNELTGQYVRPLVAGVRHRVIEVSSGGGLGFAVTLVPESDAGPHMAMAGDGRYYKRSGASFYPMEHFDIADMFAQRRRPLLRVGVQCSQGGTSGGGGRTEYRGHVVLTLMNDGRGTAVAPYLGVRVVGAHSIDNWGIDGNGNRGLPKLVSTRDRQHRYGGDATAVIHPGMVLPVDAVLVTADEFAGKLAEVHPLALELEYAAEGWPLTRARLKLTAAQVEALVTKGHTPSPQITIISER